jgi:hypothetical protein
MNPARGELFPSPLVICIIYRYNLRSHSGTTPSISVWLWRTRLELFFAFSGLLICPGLLDEESIAGHINVDAFDVR